MSSMHAAVGVVLLLPSSRKEPHFRQKKKKVIKMCICVGVVTEDKSSEDSTETTIPLNAAVIIAVGGVSCV